MADLVLLSDYDQLERPNVEYIIPEVIPKPGTVLLLGEAGAGKSFLALQLAFAVAQGGTFWNVKAKQGTVLYFQFDMSELIVRERMQHLRKAGVNVSGPIYTLHPATAPKGINILRDMDYAILKDAIDKANPDLIIFDVLREMHNADEDNSTEMKPVGDALMSLIGERAALILHHPKKINSGFDPKAVDASRGSTYLPGKVDIVWMLHDSYLYIGKSRIGPGGKYRLHRQKSGLWSFD